MTVEVATLTALVAELEAEVAALLSAAKHEPDREGKIEMRAEANGVRIAASRLRALISRVSP